MYNLIILLYTWNYHSIANQLYFNKQNRNLNKQSSKTVSAFWYVCGWVLPEVDSKTKIQVQVVYLEGELQAWTKQWGRDRQRKAAIEGELSDTH